MSDSDETVSSEESDIECTKSQREKKEAAKEKKARRLVRLASNNRMRTLQREFASHMKDFLRKNGNVVKPFMKKADYTKMRKSARRMKKFHVNTNTMVSQPSYIVSGKLRRYQIEGILWLLKKRSQGANAILGDEMGLGKTLQTITFLSYLHFELPESMQGPSIVVSPLSVLENWASEFKRWCPKLKVLKFHSPNKDVRVQLKKKVKDLRTYDVVITTYEMLKSEESLLGSEIWWHYMILDEGHRIKNEMSKMYKVVKKVKRVGSIVLTGTPIQNNVHEFWTILTILFPGSFRNPEAFEKCFRREGNMTSMDKMLLEKAHELLHLIMIRRLKKEVTNLPPKIETNIMIPLSEMQRYLYKKILMYGSTLVDDFETSDELKKRASEFKALASILMELRKCCNHPYMFHGVDENPSANTDVGLITASGKMTLLDRLLVKLFAKGHRVLIFSQFNYMLTLIQRYLNMKNIPHLRLDGSISRIHRAVNVRQFNRADSEYKVFLLQTRAGGLGVNLQTADTVIIFDSDWNPQPDIQAMARAHRIGQKKVVHVYRLVTAGSIEERILAVQRQKLFMDTLVTRKSTAVSQNIASKEKAEKREKLLEALKFGANAIFKPPKEITDEELDHVIDRTRGVEEKGEEKKSENLKKVEINVSNFESYDKLVSTRKFEGEMYTAEGIATLIKKWKEKRDGNNANKETGTDSTKKSKEQNEVKVKFNSHEKTEQVAMSSIQTAQGRRSLRKRKERLMTIDGVSMLKENFYIDDTSESIKPAQTRTKRLPGRDYPNTTLCGVCFEGGALLCCDFCPAGYHTECIGYEGDPEEEDGKWRCYLHHCCVCGKMAKDIGGAIFACRVCPLAFCDEHLKDEAKVVFRNPIFESLSGCEDKRTIFVECSKECIEWKEKNKKVWDDAVKENADERVQFLQNKKEREKIVKQKERKMEIDLEELVEPTSMGDDSDDDVIWSHRRKKRRRKKIVDTSYTPSSSSDGKQEDSTKISDEKQMLAMVWNKWLSQYTDFITSMAQPVTYCVQFLEKPGYSQDASFRSTGANLRLFFNTLRENIVAVQKAVERIEKDSPEIRIQEIHDNVANIMRNSSDLLKNINVLYHRMRNKILQVENEKAKHVMHGVRKEALRIAMLEQEQVRVAQSKLKCQISTGMRTFREYETKFHAAQRYLEECRKQLQDCKRYMGGLAQQQNRLDQYMTVVEKKVVSARRAVEMITNSAATATLAVTQRPSSTNLLSSSADPKLHNPPVVASSTPQIATSTTAAPQVHKTSNTPQATTTSIAPQATPTSTTLPVAATSTTSPPIVATSNKSQIVTALSPAPSVKTSSKSQVGAALSNPPSTTHAINQAPAEGKAIDLTSLISNPNSKSEIKLTSSSSTQSREVIDLSELPPLERVEDDTTEVVATDVKQHAEKKKAERQKDIDDIVDRVVEEVVEQKAAVRSAYNTELKIEQKDNAEHKRDRNRKTNQGHIKVCPYPVQLAQLMTMGFSNREKVIEVLMRVGGDVMEAYSILSRRLEGFKTR